MFTEDRILAWDGRRQQLDRAIEWLLVLLLAFMPLAFGAVEPWSEEIVVALAAAICLCFCARMAVGGRDTLPRTWAYVPILVFVGIALVQLVPLPVSLVQLLSPNTVAQKMKAFNDSTEVGALPSTTQLSFYAYATKHDLRLVLAAVAVFVTVLGVFRRPQQIARLLLAVTIIGASVALLALVQNIAGNGKIYWLVPSPHGSALSGPFVNHNHYAQFMNLSIGAALALVFVKVHRKFRAGTITPAAVTEYLSSPDGRLIWGCLGLIVLGTATIFASLSRGGMISLMIAGTFTTLILSSRRPLKGYGWIMALLALGAFICVLYIGFDAVYERLGSLRQLQRAEGGRWQIVQDIAVAWTRFPVLGTGLGTHEVVYPMFDRSTVASVASYAENEYAQAAEETGIMGLIALAAFGVLIWRSYARTIRISRQPIHSAAYGLGFALVAISIQSLSDFGQHVPANLFLSVIFCALLLRLPRIDDDEDGEAEVSARRFHRGWIATLAVLAVVWTAAFLDADRARVGQTHWRRALTVESTLAERQWQGSDQEYTYLISQAQKAAACQPGNVVYRHWLNVYRWRAISRITDPNTGRIILPTEALSFAQRIAGELNQTRRLCPTFGATWCVLGQLEQLVLGQPEQGAMDIREGVRLAPCDPTARFVAGLLEAEEGRLDMAADHLIRAAQLDGHLFQEVTVELVERLDRPCAALMLASDDLGQLSVLAEVLDASTRNTAAVGQVRQEVVTSIERQCAASDAPAWALAWLADRYEGQGRDAEAIRCYRRAVAADFSKASWHFSLAGLLAEAGSVHEAIQEAKTCLQLWPEHAPCKRLIERLTADPRLAEQFSRATGL